MGKLKSPSFFFLLLLCMVLLFGCARTRIIDKISIVHVFGFDQDKDNLIGTALFPDYTANKEGDEIQYLEEQAPTTVSLVSKMAAHTSMPIELAKIRVLLFGKDYAEGGIEDVVDRLLMTPQLGTSIQIAASTHSAKETLKTFKKEKSLTLYEQIQQNMEKQNLPEINLHIFLNQFYGEGMDAYVPMLTIDENERIKVEGIGVFKDDKLKLHLTPEQTVIFSFVKDYRTQATYQINLDGHYAQREMIVARARRSKKDWDWDQKKEKLNLRLHLQVSLAQIPVRFNVGKQKDIKELEKIIIERLEKEIKDLLATLKENQVDPIGIGNIVRSKDKTWEKDSFYRKYPSLPIDVKVKVEIINSGLES